MFIEYIPFAIATIVATQSIIKTMNQGDEKAYLLYFEEVLFSHIYSDIFSLFHILRAIAVPSADINMP
jgi:hypothetical protein